MRGRGWLILGAVVGVILALGHVAYLAGAARSLADAIERVVGSGGHRLITSAAHHGASQRVVEGATSLVAVLLPGVTALLLVLAAKGTLRLRAVVALLIVAFGAAAFAYQPRGHATGVLVLVLIVAGLAVVLTGPLVAAPLCALAGLIAGQFLPRVVTNHGIAAGPVNQAHLAIFGTPGTPLALRVGLLVVACVPFVFAARSLLTS
jgi:hypothetical protein